MWKKLIFKVISAGFVMAGLSLYAGYLTTGQLPPFINRFRHLADGQSGSSSAPGWSNIGALSQKSTDAEGGYQKLQGGHTTIYKWQDAKGVWQYSERAPLNGPKATKVDVVTTVKADAAEKPPVDSTAPAANGNAPVLANPYSPEGVKQIMEKAKQAQQLMNQHNKQQEQL